MGAAGAARRTAGAGDLFDRIGAFLADHRLACDPGTYALVHAFLDQPDSPLAREVARLTDGGVRLSRTDVEQLGGKVGGGTAESPRRPRDPSDGGAERQAAALVSQTQAQVDGFAAMMRAMRHETQGLGRDLAAGAAAIGGHDPRAIADFARVAAAMVARVRESESRLAQAHDEADALRLKLADAQKTARRDPMTALPNRLAFTEAFAGRSPSEEPHCLAVCDVDRFKRVNDEHGHGVGDRVLTAIGETLAEVCQGHLVARYGGEEFAILLAGVKLADAAALLDAARERIAAKRFRVRDTDQALGAITISAGVVAIRAGEGADDATERADQLLYTAKAEGRDRICAG